MRGRLRFCLLLMPLIVGASIPLVGQVASGKATKQKKDSVTTQIKKPDSVGLNWNGSKMQQTGFQQADLNNDLNKMSSSQTLAANKFEKNPAQVITKKIYSNKKLKAIYDSMGIKKMDSALAQAATKKEVTPEELIRKLNLSFLPADATSNQGIQNRLSDLSASKLKNEALQEMTPMSGTQLTSLYRRRADSIANAKFKKIDSANLKRRKTLDSLYGRYRGDQRRVDSAMFALKGKSGLINERSLQSSLDGSL